MRSAESISEVNHVHRRRFLIGLPTYAAVSTGIIATFDRVSNLLPVFQEGKPGEVIRKSADAGLAALAALGAVNAGICAEMMDKIQAIESDDGKNDSTPYSYRTTRFQLAKEEPISYFYKREGVHPAEEDSSA